MNSQLTSIYQSQIIHHMGTDSREELQVDHGANSNFQKRVHSARANNEPAFVRNSSNRETRGSRPDIEVGRLESQSAATCTTATPPSDHQHLTQSFDQVVLRVTQQEFRPTAPQKCATVASDSSRAAAAAAATAGIDYARSAAALVETSRSLRTASVGRETIVVAEKKQAEGRQEEVELQATKNRESKLDLSPFLTNLEQRKRKKIAVGDQRDTNRTRDGAKGERGLASLLKVKRAGVKSSCGGKNNMTPGLLSGQEQDCIARGEQFQHQSQFGTADTGASSSVNSAKAIIVHETDQERRADSVAVDVGGGFDTGPKESQLGEYSRPSGLATSTRRLSSIASSDPIYLSNSGNLIANISAPSLASSSAIVELANQGAPLDSTKHDQIVGYEAAKRANLGKQAGQQALDYPFHSGNFQHHRHQQQQYPHHQQHSIAAASTKINGHQQFVQHYGLSSDRLVNSYHSSSLPTFMLASHHHHQLKLNHAPESHYNPILTGPGGVGGISGSIGSNIADSATGHDTPPKISLNCATAATASGNSVARAETVAAGPQMIARAHQLQLTRPAEGLNQSYTSYANLMTSSKSSSPNSTTSTPSPKSSAMQTLSGQHSVNQLLPAGFNQSAAASAAMVAAESHLGHINQHYISSNTSGSPLVHPHHQQHYAYAAQQTAALAVPNHHQHHHLGGIGPQDQTATAATYNHIQHHHQQHQQHQHHEQQSHQLQQQQQQQQHQHQQQQHQSNMTSQQQSIYHQIVDSGINVGSTHAYAVAGANNNATYHSQLHASNNQANNLISDASQSHLNNAAAACAAAAVVSQTLKTVANQHNQHQQHQYGGTINSGFGPGTNLMNMATKQHQQFHPMSAALGQHQHHVVHGTQAGPIGSQHGQIHHQQSQQHTQSLSVHHQTNSIIARKYQCKMCPQVFMSKAEMKYHNQNHLREAKPYKCLQCPKAFANSSYLSQHMRIHQGLKPYTCDICTRKFTQLSHLQQHKRTHTGDKPYKCNYMNCTKQFSQLSNLQSHSRCHQLDKPFKCNSCYKCFHDEQSLLEHIPRHLESKHLKKNLCIFCGSSYQQERGLVKHFQQYHTDKTPTLVAAAIAAGTTGNTSLIASLVSSSQSKFATPSGGNTNGSISSSSSTTSSIGGNAGNISGHNNIANVNNNTQSSNISVSNLNSTTAQGTTPLTNVGYHLSGASFM